MPNIPISIPKIGESVAEATLTQWLVKEGELLQKDQIFVEVTTDKVTSELPSEFAGTLVKIHKKANEVARIGEPIAELLVSEEDYQLYKKYSNPKTDKNLSSYTAEVVETTSLLPDKFIGKAFLSPIVRKIAAEEGLTIQQLQNITPTGNRNRITKKDLETYLGKGNENTNQNTTSTPKKLPLFIDKNDTVKPLAGIRKTIAHNLQESYQHIPHVTTMIELDVTQMVENRRTNKENFFKKHKAKLTYTHYFMYEAVKALEKYPQLNSWMNIDEWILKKNVNLGFATALANGDLLVPNIKNAEKLSLEEMVIAINNTANKAKNNKLQAQDFEQTTFTISNTGIFGSLMGTPIIVRPQVAVLALGQIRDGIDLDANDNVIRVKKMFASLSYDHRVIDGAMASKYLSLFKQNIETNYG